MSVGLYFCLRSQRTHTKRVSVDGLTGDQGLGMNLVLALRDFYAMSSGCGYSHAQVQRSLFFARRKLLYKTFNLQRRHRGQVVRPPDLTSGCRGFK